MLPIWLQLKSKQAEQSTHELSLALFYNFCFVLEIIVRLCNQLIALLVHHKCNLIISSSIRRPAPDKTSSCFHYQFFFQILHSFPHFLYKASFDLIFLKTDQLNFLRERVGFCWAQCLSKNL